MNWGLRNAGSVTRVMIVIAGGGGGGGGVEDMAVFVMCQVFVCMAWLRPGRRCVCGYQVDSITNLKLPHDKSRGLGPGMTKWRRC